MPQSARLARLAAMALIAPFVVPTMATAQPTPAAQSAPPVVRPDVEWVTLGTMGGPMPSATRAEPANLLVHGGKLDLVDAGDGAATAFLRAGGNWRALRSIWISHIHFDHIGGLFGVLGLRLQTRSQEPLTIYGPPGTKAIVDGLVAAMKPSARSGFGVPGEVPIDPAATVRVVELDDGSTVMLGDTRVTAAANSHYSFPAGSDEARTFRSLSFRFDLPGKSIVYTGDTGPSEAVTRLAKNADLLVTELIDVEFTIANLRRRATDLSATDLANMETHLRTHHITTADIGAMAAAAGVKSVVITHIAGGGANGGDASDRYVAEVKRSFAGEVTVASDLKRFAF
ncbi:MBL fold metallo-hydrolase [Novosphingobium flavum]|uniref:MBL fold metallo-hydrolase n=1 Tax=Novosphingobium aerophilum TaxID=2839843 RepID=UPI00163AF530|nr:MBL fold metallo-hydrolase [Novosphingobium aerophilum]MBC2663521.1 MBL fold metallo-hydrolase [Novosphingobium aerophilum]